jgi:hypothetical protein
MNNQFEQYKHDKRTQEQQTLQLQYEIYFSVRNEYCMVLKGSCGIKQSLLVLRLSQPCPENM